jgi:hypothetical protein
MTGEPRHRVRTEKDERRHQQLLRVAWVTASLTAAGIVVGAGIAIYLAHPWRSGDSTPSEQPHTSSAPPGTALAVAPHWPTLLGCDGATEIGVPAGAGPITSFHSANDARSELINQGGGAWQSGTVTLDLSVSGAGSVDVTDIKPHILRSDLPSPAWVFQPEGGCGGETARLFHLALDNPPALTDRGLDQEDSQPSGAAVPTAALGPAFVLTGTEHDQIQVHAVACRGNYEWNLGVNYVVTGQSTVHTVTVGPYISYGRGQATIIYSGNQDSTGAIKVDSQSTSTGVDPGCAKHYDY